MNEEKRGVLYNRQLHHTIIPAVSFGICGSPNRPRSGNDHLTSGCPALTDYCNGLSTTGKGIIQFPSEISRLLRVLSAGILKFQFKRLLFRSFKVLLFH
jgi:hypothetical protein